MNGVMQFEKKGKFSPHYVGTFLIIEKIKQVAYQLTLQNQLQRIHDVFHFSILWKFLRDEVAYHT